MMSSKVQDAFNEQMKHEFYSSYLYLSMLACLDAANVPGLAKWMRGQSREEANHALKVFDHLLDRCGKVQLHPIDRPPADFTTRSAW